MVSVTFSHHGDNIIWKITEPNSEFYLICFEGKFVGGIRIRHHSGNVVVSNVNWISPIFVIPAFQNRGIAQKAIQKAFELYPETITWKLDTIKQESGNCHLYEKCGFIETGKHVRALRYDDGSYRDEFIMSKVL